MLKITKKLISSAAAVALTLSLSVSVPASAYTPFSSTYTSSVSATSPVVVTQSGVGSYFGTLEWAPVPRATGYWIYKTGNIRPTWRLFFMAPPTMTKLTVSDRPGAIAIYRVMAIVDSRETLVGRFKYKPKR